MDKKYAILIVSVTILVLYFAGTASATNWSVDSSGGAEFTGIQDAINNAKDGDTILVYSGIYYENVVVTKSVTLMGNGQPVIDADGEGNAITLTEDGITLVGFTATNSGSFWNDAGIAVISNNNTITGSNASNNSYNGIGLYDFCNNNTITGNNVSNNNRSGISLYFSSNNFITGNNVSNNEAGISLSCFSNNNTITGNNVSNNRAGIHLGESSNNTITGNNVSNSNRGGIGLHASSNNNTIKGNNASNNRYGIYLYYSSNNTITGNNVSNNNIGGIGLYYSSNNRIYFNNFINNTDNVDSYASTNIWNSPLEITYTYSGSRYKSYLGNSWDDYRGTDAEGDGIGDTHYSIDSEEDGSDLYPLMKPNENYILPTSAPA
ncbi:MAG: NosD domain-containing protein [Halobacteriota archaeon]